MDNEHLRLLRIGYLIAGGTTLFATIIGLFYMGIGIFFASMLSSLDTTGEPNEFMSVVFIGIGAAIVLVLSAVGALQLLTAKYLRERRNHTLCQVAAALTCLSMPWGTAVGVATFMVLGRTSVRQQFGLLPPPPQAPQL